MNPTNFALKVSDQWMIPLVCCLLPCRSEKVLALLKQHIKWLTSRVNTYTGVTFNDDPTILGYNIFNEARWVTLWHRFLKAQGS
jgi:hypothetical protein